MCCRRPCLRAAKIQNDLRILTERLAHSNVILVSHSMADIRKYCNIVVHVDRGNTVLYEDVEAGIAAYQKPAEKPAPSLASA